LLSKGRPWHQSLNTVFGRQTGGLRGYQKNLLKVLLLVLADKNLTFITGYYFGCNIGKAPDPKIEGFRVL